MVNFTNITFDDEWIYANAYDRDFKVSGSIKVHRKKDIFTTDCRETNQFQKAAWSLRRHVNNNKVSQGGSRTIAWG